MGNVQEMIGYVSEYSKFCSVLHAPSRRVVPNKRIVASRQRSVLGPVRCRSMLAIVEDCAKLFRFVVGLL